MKNNIIIKKLGVCDYQKIWQEMKDFTAKRTPDTPDETWLLEHNPIFTQGVSEKNSNISEIKNTPLIKTDRGGKTTYHGPGQLICYLLFDLHRLKTGLKTFINLIENAVIEMLGEYKISAHTIKNAPGIYVENKKICSVGLKISKKCSYHGIALNVNNDLEPFNNITICGDTELDMTKVENFVSVTINEVEKKFCESLKKQLQQ